MLNLYVEKWWNLKHVLRRTLSYYHTEIYFIVAISGVFKVKDPIRPLWVTKRIKTHHGWSIRPSGRLGVLQESQHLVETAPGQMTVVCDMSDQQTKQTRVPPRGSKQSSAQTETPPPPHPWPTAGPAPTQTVRTSAARGERLQSERWVSIHSFCHVYSFCKNFQLLQLKYSAQSIKALPFCFEYFLFVTEIFSDLFKS